ncbi:hypothetical protein CRG98_018646 [Punica granatum]|uniref:Uncharacterized protein n=1 Tax=Punica granatum TaxID=22663 RepID=A0A2I0JYS3_PUNGR|nr:hypothetical protein CRG98_018646 [Punica granatum]
MTTSSRGRVRVVRNPLNVMARLGKVVGGNGTSLRHGCTRLASLGPDSSYGQNTMMEASNGKTKPGNGLRGWEICRLGSLVIFGFSRAERLPEYRTIFR